MERTKRREKGLRDKYNKNIIQKFYKRVWKRFVFIADNPNGVLAQTRIKTYFFGRFKTARLNAYQNALVFIAGYKFSKLRFKTLFRRFKRGDKHTQSVPSWSEMTLY